MAGDRRLTKNEKRRLKKKTEEVKVSEPTSTKEKEEVYEENSDDVDIEYVAADVNDLVASNPVLEQFKEIFEKFSSVGETVEDGVEDAVKEEKAVTVKKQDEPEVKKVSKKKKKLMSRLSVAELKQLVQRPDVVEAHDVTSSDPRLLVYLKASRNTVPVPRHWCHKRKYLQGKRGMEKPPFQLPDFIADTGIARIRESVLESESLKKSKQKARDKMTPKMGKIDIDYQVLHDAFFKYQTKPKMSSHGDLYYEGKEYEVDMKEKKPGVLSEELVTALGMLENAPPPWLVNMQRYGPPPSYPNLRIPGLNAPIPEGASYGYHPGGWGKPPVDEYGRPLYGDVFGTYAQEDQSVLESIDRSHWGELGAASSDSSSEEESDSEEEDEGGRGQAGYGEGEESGMETPLTLEGMSSVTSGLETPDTIDLRKREGVETPSDRPRELYQVLQEKKGHQGAGGQFFGSDKGYVVGKGAVEVSINPDQLESEIGELGSKEGLRDTYEAQLAAKGGEGEFDADQDHDPRQKRKRRAESGAQSKRHKDFKF